MQSRDDTIPVQSTVVKESITKIDGNPRWTQVFNNDELTAESYIVYNDNNQLLRFVTRGKSEGKWSEIKYVYEYVEF
jgi:hypothetical protein